MERFFSLVAESSTKPEPGDAKSGKGRGEKTKRYKTLPSDPFLLQKLVLLHFIARSRERREKDIYIVSLYTLGSASMHTSHLTASSTPVCHRIHTRRTTATHRRFSCSRRRIVAMTTSTGESSDDKKQQPRVLIAGAGVIGSSIAYHLALKGVKATLYDQVGVGCAASGKAGGFLGRERGSGTVATV